MRRFLRKLVPQIFINYFKHLPEAVLANIFYGFPSRKLKVIGVTGTDGKTTTVNMIYEILKRSGKNVSMISTIRAQVGDESFDTGFHVTSPSSFFLQKILKKAWESGSEYMVLEVTSHGLDQFRFWGINFEVGVITNVTNEHLDYHKTFENYLLTKAKLIENTKTAVLNSDEDHFEQLRKLAKDKVVSFGLSDISDFNMESFPIEVCLPGDINMLNGLAASAVCKSLDINEADIKKALKDFCFLPGRMEEIENKLGIKIVVDFAHTPNALENALKILKERTQGKVISIFGAASERDDTKRPVMGAISARMADITILTDEDPRFEDREKIIEEIEKGAIEEGAVLGKTLFKESDRFKAIKMGITEAHKGDVVGIFGKGHERSMSYEGVEKNWSDKGAVLKILKAG